MASVYVPGFGFRPADGVKMRAPVVIEQGQRALKVLDLSTTSAATEVTFEIRDDSAQDACLAGSLEHDALMKAQVALRDDRGIDYPRATNGRESLSLGQHEFGFFGRTLSFERLPADARQVVLAIRGKLGDWDVPVELGPITASGAIAVDDLTAEATTRGVTVRLVRAAFASDRTFVELEATSTLAATSIRGMGDLQRDGADRLVIVDGSGGRHVEELSRETVRRPDVPQGRAYAMFGPLPVDEGDLTLVVPSVLLDDEQPSLDVPLPLHERREMRLGRYPIVLGPIALVGDLPSAPGAPAGHGLRFAIGPAGDQDEVALRPLSLGVDGAAKKHGWGWGWHPEPGLRNMSIDLTRDVTPTSLRLEGAIVKVRGPWEIRVTRPR
jgi:hypothetical protein